MKLFIAFFLSSILYLTFTLIFANPTHAATFTVATGNDENTDNSSCSLSEAIENINDQATTNTDCSPTGAYGTDDTINLPTGTITLTADLPQITEAMEIIGQGMDVTTIDQDGQWIGVHVLLTEGNFSISGLTFTNVYTGALVVQNTEQTSISQVEIDGHNADGDGYLQAIGIDNDTSYDALIRVSDVYIHDFDVDETILALLNISTSGQSHVDGYVDRVTVTNATNTGNVNPVLFGLGTATSLNGSEDITVTASNVTLADITAGVFTFGIGIANFGSLNAVPTLHVRNSTVTNITNPTGNPMTIPAVGAGAAATNDGETASAAISTTNVVVYGSEGDTTNCGVFDMAPFVGSLGTGTGTFTSQGGNLSDDTSCNSYFNHSTDQNNLTGLGSTLSALADNGGYVPTMALKQNSPAIDSGITIPTLTTDARGAIRPQGNAYDSGAYESPYTQSEDSEGSESLAETGENTNTITALAILLVTTGLALVLRKRHYA